MQRVIGTTLRICVITTSITLLLAYVVAYVLTHASPRAQRLMVLGVLLPLWIVGAGPRLRLGDAAAAAGAGEPGAASAWASIDEPLALIWNEFGVIIGMVHYMLPLGVLPLWRRCARSTRVARRGARPGRLRFTAFMRVFLPLCRPGVIARGAGLHLLARLLHHPGDPRRRQDADGRRVDQVQILDSLRWGMGAMLATVLVAAILAMLAVSAAW